MSAREKEKPVLDFPAPLCDVQHLVLSDLFFLQQAEVALAMLLLIEAAFLMSGIGAGTRNESAPGFLRRAFCYYRSGDRIRRWRFTTSQWASFSSWRRRLRSGSRADTPADSLDDRTFRCGVSVLSLVYEHVSGVFGLYGQPDGLGKTACARMYQEVLRTLKNLLLGHGPRNFRSTDAAWCFCLCWREVCFACRKNRNFRGRRKKNRYSLLDWQDWCLRRWLLTAYMGEMIVTRSGLRFRWRERSSECM